VSAICGREKKAHRSGCDPIKSLQTWACVIKKRVWKGPLRVCISLSLLSHACSQRDAVSKESLFHTKWHRGVRE
jgi:hypothetical protein